MIPQEQSGNNDCYEKKRDVLIEGCKFTTVANIVLDALPVMGYTHAEIIVVLHFFKKYGKRAMNGTREPEQVIPFPLNSVPGTGEKTVANALQKGVGFFWHKVKSGGGRGAGGYVFIPVWEWRGKLEAELEAIQDGKNYRNEPKPKAVKITDIDDGKSVKITGQIGKNCGGLGAVLGACNGVESIESPPPSEREYLPPKAPTPKNTPAPPAPSTPSADGVPEKWCPVKSAAWYEQVRMEFRVADGWETRTLADIGGDPNDPGTLYRLCWRLNQHLAQRFNGEKPEDGRLAYIWSPRRVGSRDTCSPYYLSLVDCPATRPQDAPTSAQRPPLV